MKLLTLCAVSLCLFLTACAGGAVRDCTKLAGPGWSSVATPANANALLQLQGLPSDVGARWFAHGSDGLLACVYAPPINNPACGSSTAYIYNLDPDGWHFRNLAIDTCYEKE